jgi:hypothetical protein
MFTTPVPAPVTTPVELTVATVGVPLVHDPPAGEPVSDIDVPAHSVLLPPEITSTGLTVNPAVTKAVPTLYVIVAVPTETPETTPVVETTDAIAGLLLLQVPPAVASVSADVHPTHVVVLPVMGEMAYETSETTDNNNVSNANFFIV